MSRNEDRAERLAAALRANLRRRKTQARARNDGGAGADTEEVGRRPAGGGGTYDGK